MREGHTESTLARRLGVVVFSWRYSGHFLLCLLIICTQLRAGGWRMAVQRVILLFYIAAKRYCSEKQAVGENGGKAGGGMTRFHCMYGIFRYTDLFVGIIEWIW